MKNWNRIFIMSVQLIEYLKKFIYLYQGVFVPTIFEKADLICLHLVM